MEHGTMLFTAIVGIIGQYAKSRPSIPNWLPQFSMLALGLVWYAGNHGLPRPEAHTFQAVFVVWADWLEVAILSAAAVPGVASLISLHPALKTRAMPNP